ncbi:hypothetical protein, partial [Neisseria sicca]|uniref:hypothetical protein n=1 Tax=Neisseria sicca TaxID=490 RepID=UPI001C998F0E
EVLGLLGGGRGGEGKEKGVERVLREDVEEDKEKLKEVEKVVGVEGMGKESMGVRGNGEGKGGEIGFEGYLGI